ncbi:MAG: hypothetical protein RL748_1546 [Pseudomonadota bacterium]|jgi:hypothetical protein
MKKQVELAVAVRNQLIEDTIGMMELDQALLDSVSGGDTGKTGCYVAD